MASVSRSVDLREAGLRLRSITDAMTGLWNYPMFVELAEQAIRERADGEVLALLFLDLDKFKQLNEELGHFDADQVLREIALPAAGVRRRRRRPSPGSPATSSRCCCAGSTATPSPTTCRAWSMPSPRRSRSPGGSLTVHVSVGVGVSERRDDSVEEVMRVAEEHMRRPSGPAARPRPPATRRTWSRRCSAEGAHRGRVPADPRRPHRRPVGV